MTAAYPQTSTSCSPGSTSGAIDRHGTTASKLVASGLGIERGPVVSSSRLATRAERSAL